MPKASSKKKDKKKTNKVPYARGFNPPTLSEQQQAIGFVSNNTPREYEDCDGTPFFSPIPEPTSIDDWLAQYNEEGQSFKQYKQENPWFSRRKHKFLRQAFHPSGTYIRDRYPDGKIYIVRIGEFKENLDLFDNLLDYVKRFLCLPVQVLEGVTIERKLNDLILVEDPVYNPSSRPGSRIKRTTLQTRFNGKTGHLQISVDSILPRMQNIIPHDALCLIGLTQFDLYADITDLFVAGMASGMQRVAVFSLYRYNPAISFSQEFWYDIQEDKSIKEEEISKLMLQRSCKLLVHELSHLLGIDHCIYYRCCMNGSGHLTEDFDQPMMLCPVDLHKLQVLVGFDITQRYQGLLEFYQKHSLKDEAEWMERRIGFLEKFQKP